ncbi:MAG: peptidase C39 family protein, partial [Chloroflexia bacterium]
DAEGAQPGKDSHAPGAYNGSSFFNGGDYFVGAAVSPLIAADFGFTEGIASWNTDTPDGTWVETQLRVQVGERWTEWYSMGVWAASCSIMERHSVGEQDDSDAAISTDTLVLKDGLEATAFQVKMRLFTTDHKVSPQVRGATVAISTTPVVPAELQPGNPRLWGKRLNVPQCSQMVYPDGGNVWCSAVSVSMVLAYWAGDHDSPCEQRVRATVEGVYDWLYDGHGNWPFNTAYAALHNLEGYVARFTSLAQVEPWIERGVPVIISYAWDKGELDGAAVASSDGHLGVLVGFDAEGNPVVNDPAAKTDDTVQRIYNRAQLETLWLQHSGGTVYIISDER